jgi:hypothetical protein
MNVQNTIPPSPLLRTNRFWDALRYFNKAVIPLERGSDTPVGGYWDGFPGVAICDPATMGDQDILDLECTDYNVGLACGAVSGCTLLAAETIEADEWIIQHNLPSTAQSWSRVGRYYHFRYCSPEQLRELRFPVSGVRILNDGDYMTYPGSVYDDGRIANWEIDPAWDETADFPLEQLLG